MVGSFVSPYMTNASNGVSDYKYIFTDLIPKTLSYSLTRKHDLNKTDIMADSYYISEQRRIY
jgi:hypothetical protein